MDIDLSKYCALLDGANIIPEGVEFVSILSAKITKKNIVSVLMAMKKMSHNDEYTFVVNYLYSRLPEFNESQFPQDCIEHIKCAYNTLEDKNKLESLNIEHSMEFDTSNIQKSNLGLTLLNNTHESKLEGSQISLNENNDQSSQANMYEEISSEKCIPTFETICKLHDEKFSKHLQKSLKYFQNQAFEDLKLQKTEIIRLFDTFDRQLFLSAEIVGCPHYYLYKASPIHINYTIQNKSEDFKVICKFLARHLNNINGVKADIITPYKVYSSDPFVTCKCPTKSNPQIIYNYKITFNRNCFHSYLVQYYFGIHRNLECIVYILINWAEEKKLVGYDKIDYYSWISLILFFFQYYGVQTNNQIVPSFTEFINPTNKENCITKEIKLMEYAKVKRPRKPKKNEKPKQEQEEQKSKEKEEQNKKMLEDSKPLIEETIIIFLLKIESAKYQEVIGKYKESYWNHLFEPNNTDLSKLIISFFYFIIKELLPRSDQEGYVIVNTKNGYIKEKMLNKFKFNKRDHNKTNIILVDPITNKNLFKRTRKDALDNLFSEALTQISRINKYEYDHFYNISKFISMQNMLNCSLDSMNTSMNKTHIYFLCICYIYKGVV